MESRAWSFSGLGGPELLTPVTAQLPEPGPGEALVEIESIGLNRSDLLYLGGRYLTQPPDPSYLGQEAVGRVVALGASVDGPPPAAGYEPAVGDRVGLLVGRVDYARMGTFRSAGIYPQNALLEHPASLSATEGAGLWLTGLTAIGGLYAGGLRPDAAEGRTLLITAASSGVGILALQIARAWGAETVAATTSPDKVAALEALADHVVVTTEREPSAQAIRAATGGSGVEVCFDPVGYANAGLLYDVAAPGGQIVYYGLMAGTEAPLDLVALLRGNLGVHGFTIYRLLTQPGLLDEAVSGLSTLVAAGSVRPIIDSIHDFAEAPAALAALQQNRHLGKIVLSVSCPDSQRAS